MKRSAFLILFFALNVSANECGLTLRANEIRAQIVEAQYTAELLGLCLRHSAPQIHQILLELESVMSLDSPAAQTLLQRAEDACRMQVRETIKTSPIKNIRARETLAFESWDQW